MTAKQANTLKALNRDRQPIDHSPAYFKTCIPPSAPPPPPKTRKMFRVKYLPKFRIMDLPYDIRERILRQDTLEFVSRTSPSLCIAVYLPGINGGASTAMRLPPVTQAGDRELRMQSMLVTIKLITFEIHSGPGNAKLQRWLRSINLQASGQTHLNTGFDAVHSLYFPYFSYFPYHLPEITANNDIELARRCANLRTLKVYFSSDNLEDVYGNPETVACLRESYRLDGMLELKNLKYLALHASSCLTALKNLKVWFEEEYSQRGQATKVAIGRDV